jgi:aryl-alcohol dehydrogenase-like predicted oxidoreductase
VHLHVLDRLKERNIAVNTVQMPVNVADPSDARSFILQVMPRVVTAGMGVIAMKTFANGGLYGGAEGLPGTNPKIVPDRMTAAEALHFVWSLPVSVAVCGVHSPAMLQEKIDAARAFKPLSEDARAAIVAKVADLAGVGVEVYKSDKRRSPEMQARDAARAATQAAASQAATRPQ